MLGPGDMKHVHQPTIRGVIKQKLEGLLGMKTKTKLSKSKGQGLSPGASASPSISAAIRFIQVDSFKIAYKVIGKGKPIIFLTRFRGTLNDWDPAFVDAVAKSYKVILFDQPGVGRSGGTVPVSVT